MSADKMPTGQISDELRMYLAGAQKYAYKGTEHRWDILRAKFCNVAGFWREGCEPIEVTWYSAKRTEVALKLGEPWWLIPDEDTNLPFREAP